MTKSTKMMREFTAKLKKLNLGDKKEATTIRDLHVANLEGYADMVDGEWNVLKLKIEILKKESVKNEQVLTCNKVLEIIKNIMEN